MIRSIHLSSFLFCLVPSEPQNVEAKALNSTSLNVSWIAPAKPYGTILGYAVYYQEQELLGKKEGYIKTNDTGNRLFEVLIALKESTSYQVRVQAFTSAGGGNWSKVAEARTLSGGRNKHIPYANYIKVALNNTVIIYKYL